jgi:hypothetical protein
MRAATTPDTDIWTHATRRGVDDNPVLLLLLASVAAGEREYVGSFQRHRLP